MAQKTLTIYEVPAAVRQKGTAAARANIVQLLSQPISQEYRQELMEKLAWVGKVAALDVVEVVAPPASQREPVHHSVGLEEELVASVEAE